MALGSRLHSENPEPTTRPLVPRILCSGPEEMATMLDLASDWTRLSIVPVAGDQALVIDRGNGKWILTNSDNVPYLQLLNAPRDALIGPVRERRDEIADHLYRLGLGGRSYDTPGDLNTVILKLTKACNFGCTYCYDLEPEDELRHLSLDTAITVLREALELAPRHLGVILHGGEPTLLFKLLRDIVLAGEGLARELVKDIQFIGQTNLSCLTDEMVEFFLDHDIHWGVSLDGPPELHDKFRLMRNGKGTYHHFEKALARYPEFVRSCGVMSVITGHNDAHLLRIARHFRDLGMPAWDWSLFYPIGQGRLQAQLFQFDMDRLLESWDELFDAVEDGEFDGMRIAPVSSYLQNFLLGPGRNMCMKRNCGAGRDLLSISSNGTIEACDCIDTRGPYSNLGLVQIGGSDSLHKARTSTTADRIRSRDVSRGPCHDCAWFAVCGGTCMAHAPELHGRWEPQCRLSMLAFSRIANSLAASDALRRYWKSIDRSTDAAAA